jgi:hypothetical protein
VIPVAAGALKGECSSGDDEDSTDPDPQDEGAAEDLDDGHAAFDVDAHDGDEEVFPGG